MELGKLTDWLDRTLRVGDFDDVSNNGLQVARTADGVETVAVAVDASVRAVRAAAAAGAQLLVVHHGISWGGGIRRLTGGVYAVVKAAMDADLAIYACHLPLDAHERLGNNWNLARYLGLRNLRKAFSYHGNVIGVTGVNRHGRRIGVCSGGAGEFAEEAKRLGCDLYVTGEANWGERVAAENCGMPMVCAGHWQTEVFGVRAVAAEIRRRLRLRVVDLTQGEEGGGK